MAKVFFTKDITPEGLKKVYEALGVDFSGLKVGVKVSTVADYLREKGRPIVYITVMNAISTSCDCDAEQDDPVMEDLGIVASLDPVAKKYELVEV